MNKQMKRKYRQRLVRRRITVLIASICLIAGCGVLFGSLFADAHDNSVARKPEFKYYKSITINAGDSLWDLAQEYKTDTCTTEDYIAEIMELNSLQSENIQKGQHLVIIYYDEAIK